MDKDKSAFESWYSFVILVILIIVLWGLFWYFLHDEPERGTWGDMFGGANALFSGLAFAGVIYAIFLQRRELVLQREELIATRQELEGQKIQLQNQNETMRKQNFENTLFSLIRFHNDIVNQMALLNAPARGRISFRFLHEKLYINYKRAVELASEGDEELDNIRLMYDYVFEDFGPEIGYYFRNLYNIIKFVDDSDIPNKEIYTNLVRAQLSSFELITLFYNCLSRYGSDKFKALVEKFALLEDMPFDLLFRKSHESLYHPNAYGRRT